MAAYPFGFALEPTNKMGTVSKWETHLLPHIRDGPLNSSMGLGGIFGTWDLKKHCKFV